MESTSYRLERWIAVILSLLFFLPFVAKADDIVFTDAFHADEMPFASGDEFLVLTGDTNVCSLQPVKIVVTEENGGFERVSVDGMNEVYLIRGERLQPGLVTAAQPAFADLLPDTRNATFTLAGTPYDLFYTCTTDECTLRMESGEVTQDLVTFKLDLEDIPQYVAFAGDLDRDGKLDLIANLARHWNEWRPVLLLSTAAKNGQLVGMAAEFSTSGC